MVSTRTSSIEKALLALAGLALVLFLAALASGTPTAVMCAEAKWWQCHRQLIADALLAKGVDVRHILSVGASAPHELTPFARVTDSAVFYPALV